MISKKYIKDYTIHDEIGPGGRIQSHAVYTGADYIITPNVTVHEKWSILFFIILSGISLVCAVLPVLQTARSAYVLLPFVIAALPVFLAGAASVSFLRARGVLKRSEADKIANRLPPCSLISTLLTGVSLIGFVINAAVVKIGLIPGDIIFGALALVTLTSCAVVYLKTKRIKAALVPPANPASQASLADSTANDTIITHIECE